MNPAAPGSAGSSARTDSSSSHRLPAAAGTARSSPTRRDPRGSAPRVPRASWDRGRWAAASRRGAGSRQRPSADRRSRRAVAAERIDGNENERGRRDHRHRQHAAPGPMRGVAKAEPRHRPPPVACQRMPGWPPERDGEETQRCREQRRARAEEGTGPIEQAAERRPRSARHRASDSAIAPSS